ncbi:pentapeptide repeat-containing protein [Streptomyces sp. NPDC049910]|uniref:pentapeptide repeat-containing protein n=1 Tax=Streptomyces sp. NPDC049910 TaxID=3155278 RepID=UPI003416AB69
MTAADRNAGPLPGTSALRGDCGNCFALCCVALPFSASADFAVDKPAGRPCGNLRGDFRCGIHSRLRDGGFSGCAVYDCFGAGQKVSQVTFAGRSWRSDPGSARQMSGVFPVMRQLHELLWYLAAALALPVARPVHPAAEALREEVEGVTLRDAGELLGTDVAALRGRTGELLLRASALARTGGGPGRGKNRRGADLLGARLAGADLHAADLRGACLIAADLSGADLRLADLLGADLRDTDLSGADLTGSIFLTQPQLQQARGDAATRLPSGLRRPTHWRT